MIDLTEELSIRLCSWLYERQGLYNCIFKIDGTAYRLNQTLGLKRATEEDVAAHPELEPPDFLLDEITKT